MSLEKLGKSHKLMEGQNYCLEGMAPVAKSHQAPSYSEKINYNNCVVIILKIGYKVRKQNTIR